jgi:hypothetical protein
MTILASADINALARISTPHVAALHAGYGLIGA